MKHKVSITTGSMFNIHPSMGYLDIEESKVLVIAVGTKRQLKHCPALIYKQVLDAEEPILQGRDMTAEEKDAYGWVVYVDNEAMYCLPLEDFIGHTTYL